MKICILNASNPGKTLSLESDNYASFKEGRASCFNGQEVLKQCRSWHGWTYALETEFFVYNKDKWQGCYQYDAVIILVNRDIHELLPLVKKLKLMKKKVAISFHESVSDLITSSGVPGEDLSQRWIGLYDLVMAADFYLNIFGQMNEFFTGWFGENKVKFANHCAPLDWNHGLAKPFSERKYDILVGTRTFQQRLPRNTLIALATLNGLARDEGKSVHFLSEDGDVAPLMKRMGLNNIVCHRGPLSWVDWLKFLSDFKVIAHTDQSANLGQICMDAAMVDVAPVGSSTWLNMYIGSDDQGNTRYLSDYAWSNSENKEVFLDDLKKIIHPDTVKKQLIEAFE
jgi:hypothetical protein